MSTADREVARGLHAAGSHLDPKYKSTLVARCALLGIVLHVIEDDAGAPLFVASRWALTRQMSSTEEVEEFIKLASGQAREHDHQQA